jgi:pimeloyl-ACP methyl ester carboxylesterase
MSPGTGYCNRFAKSPTNNNEFWAACSSGVYHSVDSAKTFKKILGNSPQTGITDINLNKDGGIIAVYSNRISYSSDGIFWSNVTTPGSLSTINLFLNQNNSALYVSKVGGASVLPGLYRSTDNGLTWVKINNGSSFINGLTSMVFFDDPIKFCATSNNGFSCSQNGGFTWGDFKPLKVGADSEKFHFYSAIQNPEDNNNIIVLTGGLNTADNVIYSSKDGGLGWEPIIAPDYSGAIIASMGDVFVWSPNTNWLKGIWKKDGITTLPEYLKKHPVIIVPGILGSWKVSGKWVLDPILNIYDGLYVTLNKNGFEKGKMLFAFPYNWRKDNTETARLLKQKIDEVKLISGSNKVDIVAHSMGGLVARSYAQSDYYENDIDQIIFLGTPHLGAPKTYPIWETGDVSFDGGISGIILESVLQEEAGLNGYNIYSNKGLFEYIQEKVPALRQLLPIYNYLKNYVGGEYRYYPLGYPKNDFLYNLNDNISRLAQRKIWVKNIIGNMGENTVSGFTVESVGGDKYWSDGKPVGYNNIFNKNGISYSDGDGTVPLESDNKIFSNNVILKNVSHSELPNMSSREVLYALNVDNPNITNIGMVKKALLIIAYSPIDFYVETPGGEKVGTNMSIPNYYSEVKDAFYSGNDPEEPEFIVIPNPEEGTYKVVTTGIGNGQFEIESTYVNDENNETYSTSFIGETAIGCTDEIDVTLNTETDIIESIEKKEKGKIDRQTTDRIIDTKIWQNDEVALETNFLYSKMNMINISNDQVILGNFVEESEKNLFCFLPEDGNNSLGSYSSVVEYIKKLASNLFVLIIGIAKEIAGFIL